MKRKIWMIITLLGITVLTVFFYRSGYELRLVPNEPDLRPETVQPSPRELTNEFKLSGGSERDNRGFPQRKIVDLSSRYPSLFYLHGDLEAKKIALTFDDGPDSLYTPQILDILKENNIKATFFLVGNRARLFPDVVKRMVQEGHVVGNHTMTHANIVNLNEEQMKQEILQAEDVLQPLIGYRTALFRSPYGSLGPSTVESIDTLNYKIIAWNVDSLDWKSLTAEQVKYNILENVKNGSIVLQHCSGSTEENLTGSVSALRDVITVLRREGYQFVTIPEILNIPYQKK